MLPGILSLTRGARKIPRVRADHVSKLKQDSLDVPRELLRQDGRTTLYELQANFGH